jgi:RNA polymerase sigma factor (sigma-70 family)
VDTASQLQRLPDDALVTAMALGESMAAEVFVRRFEARVFGLACAVVRDRALAEDVAQQSFIRAWRFAGSFDASRGSVIGWLLRITRNQALDHLAMRRPEPIDPTDLINPRWSAALATSPDLDPAQRAVVADDLVRLHRELERLPVEQRRAVVLATVGARSMADIAVIEQVPVPTVKTRVRLGLRRLRAAMAEDVQP